MLEQGIITEQNLECAKIASLYYTKKLPSLFKSKGDRHKDGL